MTLEIIKRLQAIQAAVEGLAGGGAKLGDHFGVAAATAGALYFLVVLEEGVFVYVAGFGRGDAVGFEFLFAVLGHPVGRPGGG